jgi:hypothetical protein
MYNSSHNFVFLNTSHCPVVAIVIHVHTPRHRQLYLGHIIRHPIVSDVVHLLHELAYAPRGSRSCRQIYTHRDWSSKHNRCTSHHLTHVEHPRVLARLGSSVLVFIHFNDHHFVTQIEYEVWAPRYILESIVGPPLHTFHRSTGVLAEISFDSTLFTERYILWCAWIRIHRVLFINESFQLTTEQTCDRRSTISSAWSSQDRRSALSSVMYPCVEVCASYGLRALLLGWTICPSRWCAECDVSGIISWRDWQS